MLFDKRAVAPTDTKAHGGPSPKVSAKTIGRIRWSLRIPSWQQRQRFIACKKPVLLRDPRKLLSPKPNRRAPNGRTACEQDSYLLAISGKET